MLKSSRVSMLLLSALLSGSLVATPFTKAFAQATNDSLEGDISKELLDSELGNTDDAPPPAEYPYPGAKEEGVSPQEAPRTASTQASPIVEPNVEIERPKKIDPDTGEYYYDTKIEKPVAAERDSKHAPTSTTENGEYQYSTELNPPPYSNREGIEKPIEIKGNGEFKYATEETPTSGTASFRMGFFGPPMLKNADHPETTFESVYTKDQLPVLFFDYELPLITSLGHIGLKFGSGIFVASGQGQFAVVDQSRRSDDIPQERYTFFMMPNTISAQYRFQFKDKQPIVPYVEGGGGYFTFAEFRDDSAGPRIGGALTTVAAGGINFLMDWLDPDAIRNLDQEYGINHVFLTLEAREIVGLNKDYDFTSSAFNAGFLLQF